jgi:hypothetical protein
VEGLSLWDVVINGVIGAPKLLSIGRSHKIAVWLGPRVSRIFASLGALALCALVLAFAGEEAQAQLLSQAQHMAIDGQTAGKTTQPPVEATPTEETSPHETRLARTSPVEEPSPTAPGPALAEPRLPVGATLPDPEPVSGPALQSDLISGSMIVLAERDGAEMPVDPDLAAPASESTTSEPVPESVPVPPVDQETAPGPVDPDRSPLDLEPEPVAIEESDPLPLLAGEAPAAEPAVLYSGEEHSYPLYVLGTSMVDAVVSLEETLESTAANALGALVDEASSSPDTEEGEGLIYTTLAGLFYEEEAGRAPASEPGGETKPSPTEMGPEWPLQDNGPQPVSSFTPPAGSSFSLSGGHVGAGIVALLLCVLASVLILLRREFKLLWAFSELPKPSSVLLLPPERPG